MKISLKWLKKYIDFSYSTEELIDLFVNLGIEVESVEYTSKMWENFVIGHVKAKKKHPNADKLSVCNVDIGSGDGLNIVCGAPNVDKGQIVCVALPGAVIPNGGFEIKKTKIRGEISEGMICSAKELNLGDNHDGIMVLNTELKPGDPFSVYLGADDVIIDTGVTPNRGDLLSYLGLANEISVINRNKIKIPEINSDIKFKSSPVSIEIKSDGCLRYSGVLIRNVKIKESPDWLKNFLASSGIRSINNIVDVTNFVMLECGQPLHAFDFDKISGGKIIIRDADDEEKFLTLDGKERPLRKNTLLICDSEKPVALAGIMGGMNSEISETTSNVFIESAYFQPVNIRKTSKYLGLQTDSSYRFERGVDIDRTLWAALRALEMIRDLAGGEIETPVADIYPVRLEKLTVPLRLSRLNAVIGVNFNKMEVIEILSGLGLELIGENEDLLRFTIPNSRREDLKREVDLIEEVARLYGYNKIPEKSYDKVFLDIRDFADVKYDTMLDYRRYFINRGYSEIITNSLVDEDEASMFTENFVRVLNPLGKATGVLRPNLIIGAMNAVKYNLNHGTEYLRLFESGNVFSLEGEKILEKRNKILILAGKFPASVHDKQRDIDVFDIRGELESLLSKFNIEINDLNDYYYTDNFDFQMNYFSKGKLIASILKPSGKLMKYYDITKPLVLCEIY
ncbi:MAG: phenylalanine--tRNA ligase subunit beta [Ignavibacteria bacterium]|nr:phenylalanine--tRNA ligase subunit beta [Ignavibacteria bacterium]